MLRRAPVEVIHDPRRHRLATRTWALLLLAPLGCWLLNLAMMIGLDRAPRSILPYASLVLLNIGVGMVLAVSLNLINGYTGQFSLGHAGFMAIGAYVSAALMYYGFGIRPPGDHALAFARYDNGALHFATAGLLMDLQFLVTLVVAGLAAAVAGLLVGIPSLRLKGDYLAIVTLGFGEIIRVILLNMDSLGAARGFSDLEPVADLFWVSLVVVIVVLVTHNMVASTRGLAFLAVRDDEIAAEASGVNTTRYKVTAFVVGAFFAGVAGGLYAHVQAYLNPGGFDFVKSIEVVAMVVLGGSGNIKGAMVAAAGLTLLPELLRGAFLPEVIHDAFPARWWEILPRWRMVIYSLILIVAMLIQSRRARGKKA